MSEKLSATPATPPALLQALGHPLSDRRLQVLQALAACGSISQAARQVGVSYKAAWQAIDTLSNLAGVPVVHKSVGGAGGGGAKLSEAGHSLLRAAQAMEQARGAVMQQLHTTPEAERAAVQGLQTHTSMRNQWPCVVHSVLLAGPLAQVQLRSAHADWQLSARITAESAQLLALREGLPLLALCKATAVQVLPVGTEVPANTWAGKATRVAVGALGDEVGVQLAPSVHLVGFGPARSGWRAGRKVLVHVPQTAIALALPH